MGWSASTTLGDLLSRALDLGRVSLGKLVPGERPVQFCPLIRPRNQSETLSSVGKPGASPEARPDGRALTDDAQSGSAQINTVGPSPCGLTTYKKRYRGLVRRTTGYYLMAP